MGLKKQRRILIFIITSLVIIFSTCFLCRDFLLAATISTTVSIINPLGPTALIIAIPEKRIAIPSDGRPLNKGTRLKVKIFAHGADRSNPANILWSSGEVTSTDEGKYYGTVLEGFSYGYYDVTAKGYSHLTRLLNNVYIGPNINMDFTESGSNPIKCGDINLTDGDNEVNALDISVLVNAWGEDDERADLNRDNEVNAIDISNLLANFNQNGD
ncbi:MAG: dockerin type I domain-containing protein [bacterium]